MFIEQRNSKKIVGVLYQCSPYKFTHSKHTSAALGSFTRSPQDLTIPQGSIAFFECSADNAVPAPIYTWLKGGDPVVPDKTRVYVSNVTHTLLVRDVGPGDAGNYSCHVENSAGTMTSSPAALTVRSQAEFEGAYLLFCMRNSMSIQ